MFNRWPLTKAYKNLLIELSNKTRYEVRSVYEHYVIRNSKPAKSVATVVLRIDVDNGHHLALPLAEYIKQYGLTASHYFLTHPDRYYDIWHSDIPKRIHQLGQEVGLHSDHYYEQLTLNKDGLSSLREDVIKLGELIGEPVKGMVFHGHPAINALGVKNWDLTKDLESKELGLQYHDGLKSVYIQPGVDYWIPKCDKRISDFMGLPRSWGWNYLPWYPTYMLKKFSKIGEVFHLAFHTKNAFFYWENWPSDYKEEPFGKEESTVIRKKQIIIFCRYFVEPTLRRHLLRSLDMLGIKKEIKRCRKR